MINDKVQNNDDTIINIATHNTSNSVKGGGTCLMGYVDVSYAKLVSVFGKPMPGDGYKTKAEWVIQDIDSGVVATIYDYKSYKNPESNSEWHVGGTSKQSLELVRDCIRYGCSVQ